ncbi:protein disulfide-isomerase [Podospora australis]|uniref:Protein disulfide-isomerase n=1 Tax=Podospora australis TaxID=1536484 RepID=A0AAN6WL29_9PEZI|nr:protein disulfide-isomerase [Podospora australis]
MKFICHLKILSGIQTKNEAFIPLVASIHKEDLPHSTSLTIEHAVVLPSQNTSIDLETQWQALKEAEKNEPNIVNFDCQAHPEFCKELDVTTFPSIRVYHRDGRLNEYRGEKRARDIAMFLHRVLRPAYLEANEQLVDPFSLIDDVVFMMHPHPDDWDLYDRFMDIAKKYQEHHTFVIAPPFSKSTSAVVCYNNLDDARHVAEDLTTDEGLDLFVQRCAEPLIPELTKHNEARYISSGKNILYYFATTEAEKEAYRERVRPLAKKYAESVQFVITKANEYSRKFSIVGGQESGSTTHGSLLLENHSSGNIYPFEGSQEITADVIEGFLINISSGKLEPSAKTDTRGGEEASHDEL